MNAHILPSNPYDTFSRHTLIPYHHHNHHHHHHSRSSALSSLFLRLAAFVRHWKSCAHSFSGSIFASSVLHHPHRYPSVPRRNKKSLDFPRPALPPKIPPSTRVVKAKQESSRIELDTPDPAQEDTRPLSHSPPFPASILLPGRQAELYTHHRLSHLDQESRYQASGQTKR